MVWTISALLFLFWFLGFGVFPVAGDYIHVLLIMMLVIIIYHFVSRSRVY